MPIYPYKCGSCGVEQDRFNHISTRDTCPPCECGGATTRQLSAPMVYIPGDVGYRCPVTDQVVTSERQRKNIMAEHRLVDANDFKPAQVVAARKKATADRKALADQLTAHLPKEVLREATATAHAA